MSQLKISEELYPRLTVLITTCSKDGSHNVATFSFIMPVSFEPKYLAFSISPRRRTFDNIKDVGEFVVNVPTEDMLQKVWLCGSRSGRDINKIDLAKLQIVESKKVKPPRIKGCPVQLECKVEFMKEFGDHYLVVGKVVEEHVEKRNFKPILHYSGRTFFKVDDTITV
ncbi:MAG: flavin reductase family protein [Candidatus Nezhaarchaeales archaeon]